MVDRDAIIDGSDIRVGNVIIGLASSGIHSNGYSLVRKICFEELQLTVDQYMEELGCTLGEELLRPTRIYVQSVQNVLRSYKINGMVHNTGGGFYDNIPRILPNGCKAVIHAARWPQPPIFGFLASKGNVPPSEMYRTFNMGIGLMAVVNESLANDVCHHFNAVGEKAYIIGEIVQKEETDSESVTVID
jgi:phosphoribosylformylglycinamidine cyclo-ligase